MIMDFEIKIQKRIYAHKKGKKLMQIYKQFHNIYTPPERKIVSIVKRRRFRWVGYVAHTGER